jgi:ABC-type multidrug transport system fused ATPase/permease subunit
LSVPGARYLSTSFNYSRSHLWRNFGVVIAFAVLYIAITMIASELFNFTKGGGGALEFKRSKAAKNKVKAAAAAPADEESGAKHQPVSGGSSETSQTLDNAEEEEALQSISGSESIFTWENVEYTVPYMGGQKKLLNKVNGYAKPGLMIALMGASGAGKTVSLISFFMWNILIGVELHRQHSALRKSMRNIC